MSTVTSFAKQILGLLSGNEAAVIAAKNERKANSAIDSQIAALKAKEVDDEASVDDAKDALTKAKYPTVVITSNSSYIQGIKYAQEHLDDAETTLQSTRDSIKYFQAIKTDFASTVEA